jgi:hypothetical protein
MFWTGSAIGIFLGATIGTVVAGLLAASRRNDDEAPWGNPLVDDTAMDEVQKVYRMLLAPPLTLTTIHVRSRGMISCPPQGNR